MSGRRSDPSWPAGAVLIAVLLLAGVLGLTAVLVGALLTNRDDDLWLEVAKSGVQVLAVGLIGGGVAAAWRHAEQNRDRRERREADEADRRRQVRDEKIAVFRKVVEAYNETKAIRRSLRSLGLAEADGELSAVQVEGFRSSMSSLNIAQLKLEALARDVAETDVFADDTSRMASALRGMEDHLNQVLKVWEDRGSLIDAGSEAQVISNGLTKLIARPATSFKDGFVVHQRVIPKVVHEHLFGAPSPPADALLAKFDEEDDKESSMNGEASVNDGK